MHCWIVRIYFYEWHVPTWLKCAHGTGLCIRRWIVHVWRACANVAGLCPSCGHEGMMLCGDLVWRMMACGLALYLQHTWFEFVMG